MRVDKSDTAAFHIRILAPDILGGMKREYRFCAEIVGPGKGLRARLKKANLHDWRFDFAWPDVLFAVEIDGGQWMSGGGRHNTDDDREKINTAAEMGWRVLRFSASLMERDPVSFVEKIRSVLGVKSCQKR